MDPKKSTVFLYCLSLEKKAPVKVSFIYESNGPKSVPARDPGDCRDNYEKLAKRVSVVGEKGKKVSDIFLSVIVLKTGMAT